MHNLAGMCVFETPLSNRNIPPILHQTQRGSFLCQRRIFLHWFAAPKAIKKALERWNSLSTAYDRHMNKKRWEKRPHGKESM